MSCNQYTDTEVRPQRYFCLIGYSQKQQVSYTPQQHLFLDLIHLRLVTKTQCFGRWLCCCLQMGKTNLYVGPLRNSYCRWSILQFLQPGYW